MREGLDVMLVSHPVAGFVALGGAKLQFAEITNA